MLHPSCDRRSCPCGTVAVGGAKAGEETITSWTSKEQPATPSGRTCLSCAVSVKAVVSKGRHAEGGLARDAPGHPAPTGWLVPRAKTTAGTVLMPLRQRGRLLPCQTSPTPSEPPWGSTSTPPEGASGKKACPPLYSVLQGNETRKARRGPPQEPLSLPQGTTGSGPSPVVYMINR